jgi:hypothetical protein
VARLRSIVLCVGACTLAACGSAPQTDSTEPADSWTFIEVDPAVNVCPVFDRALIIPLEIPPSVSAELVVYATDPDGSDASLVYSWSAPSGTFSTPNLPATTYHCSALGPQALNVTAQDVRDCRVDLTLDVNCIAK